MAVFEQHAGLRSDENEIIHADHRRRSLQYPDAHPDPRRKQPLIALRRESAKDMLITLEGA